MSEQFAFHELGGNGAAVDRNEGPGSTGSGFVNELRHEFLPGAGFSAYVHGGLAAGHARNHFAHVVHRLRCAQETRPEHAGIAFGFFRQFDGRGHELAQSREIQGLGDEVECAQFQGAHRGLHVAVRGDDGHRNVRRVLLNPFDEFQTVAVGQLHVGQAKIELLRLEHALSGSDVAGGTGIHVHALQRDRQQFAQIRLIIDD